MPNTAAAKKALRQSITRRARNRSARSALRNLIKKFREAAAGDDRAAADEALRLVTKKLDQAASKNLLHKKTASRVKSRLAKVLNSKGAGK